MRIIRAINVKKWLKITNKTKFSQLTKKVYKPIIYMQHKEEILYG